MKLGLSRDEVKLVPFTVEWSNEFQRVKENILSHMDIESHRIEHIGSTAITNMVAKPIIDIIIGVDDITKVTSTFFGNLKEVGFLRLRVVRPGEIVLARYTDELYEVKTHYIHVVDYEKDLWNNLIFFRDYLNANIEAREEYKRLKLAYEKLEKITINKYTDLKEPFVKSIFEMRINGADLFEK
ncbi:GrpB family protein [Psychrobacillus vulpis]|uniref:GrpB family protein n=1 Tax=Psychrobacillus vulpis TaxID=2325572 RepID=A0A544TT83_9BACI|nr:GrpB family protein [Psychrobacillus vulpis]TQR20649.1 GrpB family protein [Psychrobacillus vulpis]